MRRKCISYEKANRILYLYAVVIAALTALLYPAAQRELWMNYSIAEYVQYFSSLIPLRGIAKAVHNCIQSGRPFYLYPMIAHALLFLPAGLLAGRVYKVNGETKKEAAVACIKYALLLSCLYFIRVIMRCGSFDIDDILLDMAGFAAGFCIACGVQRKGSLC